LPAVGGAAAGSGGGARSEAGVSGSARSVAKTCSSTGSSSDTSGSPSFQENGCVSHGGNWASEVCAVMRTGLPKATAQRRRWFEPARMASVLLSGEKASSGEATESPSGRVALTRPLATSQSRTVQSLVVALGLWVASVLLSGEKSGWYVPVV